MDEWERERWRGQIDSEVGTLKERMTKIEKNFEQAQILHNELALETKSLSSKFAVYAGIGAVVGGGVMSTIVGFIFKH